MKVFEIRPDKCLSEEEQSIVNYAVSVTKVFLAGTIEMGNSENWQKQYVDEMVSIADNLNTIRSSENDFDENAHVIIIANPRRIAAPEDIEAQINWELDKLEESDIIYMNLEADSKSPISLLELGLFARTGKLKVTCPKEFYRYDNVRVTCQRYYVPLRNSTEENFPNICLK